MNWDKVGDVVKSIGLPILGGVLKTSTAGVATLGMALIEAVTGKPDATEQEAMQLLQDPIGVGKAQQFYLEHQAVILRIQVEAEIAGMQAVNQTMQVEATSEHWLTANWRGIDGLMLGLSVVTTVAVILVAYCGVIFYGVEPDVLAYIPAMLGAVSTVLGTLAAVVGIHNFFHGKALADPTNTSVTK